MKKVFYILSMLLLAASCEIPFQLEQNGKARIYVQGIVHNGEVFVSTQVANPVSGKQLGQVPVDVRTSFDGDRFLVEAQADGLETASGSTTVPPGPDLEAVTARTFPIDTLTVTQDSICAASTRLRPRKANIMASASGGTSTWFLKTAPRKTPPPTLRPATFLL